MIKYIKQHLITTASIALAITGTVAAQAGVIPGVNQSSSQPNNIYTEQQLKEAETGGGIPAADPQKPTTTDVTAPPATDSGGDTGAINSSEPAPNAPTGGGSTPATNPAPVTPSEPTPVTPPAPTQTGHTMRFVDVSPAAQPNTKMAEYCDYHYSDGSTQTQHIMTITKQGGFSQPIANYSESNPPGEYSPC